jgi:uncharacterized protein YggE
VSSTFPSVGRRPEIGRAVSSRAILLVVTLLVASGVCAGCDAPLGPAPAAAPGSTQPAARLITVTGDAEVRVVPDEVVLTLGVETQNLELDAAKRQNDDIVKAAIDLAKQQGIRPEQIKTEFLNVEPRYRDNYEKRDFLGYSVRRTLVLTIQDLSKFEDLLAAELKVGVNYVHGVDFRTTELRKHKDAARSLAIKAAKEKATALAAELGLRLGDPQTIREDQSSYWSWYSSWWGAGWGSGMAQNVSQNAAGGAAGASLEGATAPGQITVRAQVTVGFDLIR